MGPWPPRVGHEPCESTAGPPQDPTLGPSGAAEANTGGRPSPVSLRTRRSQRAALPCSGRYTRDTHVPAPRNPGSSRVPRRWSCLMGTLTALVRVEARAPKGVAEAPLAGSPTGPFPTPALLRSGTCPLRSRQAEGAWPAASATNVGTNQLRTGHRGCPDLGSPWLDACRGQAGNAGCGCEGTRACGGSALGRPRQRVGEGGPQRPRQTFGTEMRHLSLVHRSGTAHLPSHTVHTRVHTHTDNTHRDWVGSSSAPPCLFPCPSRQSRECAKPTSKPPGPGRGGAGRSSGRVLRVASAVSRSARGGGGPGVASTAQLRLSLWGIWGPGSSPPWTTEGGEKSPAPGHASGQEVTHWLGGFRCRRPVRSRFLPFLLLLPQSRQKHTGPAGKPRAQREAASRDPTKAKGASGDAERGPRATPTAHPHHEVSRWRRGGGWRQSQVLVALPVRRILQPGRVYHAPTCGAGAHGASSGHSGRAAAFDTGAA